MIVTQSLNVFLEPCLLFYTNNSFVASHSGLLLSLFLLALAGGGYFIRLKFSSYTDTDTESTSHVNCFVQTAPKKPLSALKPVVLLQDAVAAPLREYSAFELQDLFLASDLKGRQIIGLLLSGLTLDETASLRGDQIDLEMSTITVFGNVLRAISVAPPLKALLTQGELCPVWDNIKPMSFMEMNIVLFHSALKASFDEPKTVTAETIRHTYIIYLLKQGLSLKQLRWVVGYIEPEILPYYEYVASQQLQQQEAVAINHTYPIFSELT